MHSDEITHTVESCLKQLWKAFKYFFAFSSLIIVGGLIFSAIEYEQNQSTDDKPVNTKVPKTKDEQKQVDNLKQKFDELFAN